MTVSARRLRELGVRSARRDHDLLRPQDAEAARWQAPDFRAAYAAERERLGDCAPDAHVFEATTVSADSPGPIERVRVVGHAIEVCSACGVWRDAEDPS